MGAWMIGIRDIRSTGMMRRLISATHKTIEDHLRSVNIGRVQLHLEPILWRRTSRLYPPMVICQGPYDQAPCSSTIMQKVNLLPLGLPSGTI